MLNLIDSEGFSGEYDFFYLPMDFKSRVSLGYAFINLLSADAAQRLWKVFDGYCNWVIPSRKLSGVSWSREQGLRANIERHRHGPVTTANVPDEFKPAFFQNGVH